MSTVQPWMDVVEKKAPSTADLDLLGKKIPSGHVVRIDAFYVIDATTANKTVKLGFVRAEKFYPLKRAAAGASTYGVHLERPLILVEEDRLQGTVEAPTSGDECKLIASGIYLC